MISSEACVADLAGIARKPLSRKSRVRLVRSRLEQYQRDLAAWSLAACQRAGEFSVAPLRGTLKERLHGILALRRRPEPELEVFELAYSMLQRG
jgi:hypothetical protein